MTVPAGRIQVLPPPPPRGQFEAKGKDGARRFWGVDRLGSQREGPSPSVGFLAPSAEQRQPAGRPPSATNPADRSGCGRSEVSQRRHGRAAAFL